MEIVSEFYIRGEGNIMMNISGGLIILRESLCDLPTSEKKAANYILENPHEILGMTINELAEKSDTSKAAVIRLTHSLGIKGFRELKLRIAGDVLGSSEKTFDISSDDSLGALLQNIANNGMKAISDTSDILDLDKLEVVVGMLEKATVINFFGLGASHIVSLDAHQKFLRISKFATAFSDLHLLTVQIASMREGDILFVVSFSGETKEVIEAVRLAKVHNVKTVSLTGYRKNTVSEMADINLFVSSVREAEFRSAATASRIAQLHVIDVLFMAVASRTYEDSIAKIDRTRKAIKTMYKDR